MPSTEVLLLSIYVGLYLYDSALLLHPNEALLKTGLGKRWHSEFGNSNATFAGKELHIPNPLTPGSAIFRLAWHYEKLGASRHTGWENGVQTLRWFQAPVWSLFCLSFLVLPAVLFGHLGDAALLLVFALVYLNVAVLTGLLYWLKDTLAMGPREFWLIALDFFICPPFAINVIRRCSLRQVVKEDFVVAANRLRAGKKQRWNWCSA